MNSNNIIAALSKPPIYTKSEVEFWNDEYISKQMLDAHLDPDFEAASRKHSFIEKSVTWIKELLPPTQNPTLLDIGCGPGLYAERFHKAGYQVTGLDFSKRSIEYATRSSKDKNLAITYLYQNYLKMDLQKQFDVCTLIYCDYGALSTDDRRIVLQKVYEHLKPGGKFLFDVFTMKSLHEFTEQQTWQVCENGGFWRPGKYIELNGNYKYSENVSLSQTTIVEQEQLTTYYIWDTYFTKESLIKEVEDVGFKFCDIYGDVAGNTYNEESETIAILLEK